MSDPKVYTVPAGIDLANFSTADLYLFYFEENNEVYVVPAISHHLALQTLAAHLTGQKIDYMEDWFQAHERNEDNAISLINSIPLVSGPGRIKAQRDVLLKMYGHTPSDRAKIEKFFPRQ